MKRKEYQQYTEQLNGSYKDCFSQIEIILKEYGLVEYDNAMSEILDMLLCAQADHKNCDVIFGTDLKKFCKEYVDSLSPHHRFESFFSTIIAFGVTIILCGYAMAFFNKIDGTIQNLNYDKINFLATLSGVFGFMSVEVNSIFNRKKSYKKSQKYRRNQYKLIFLLLMVISLILSSLLEMENIKFMVCMGDVWPVMTSLILLAFSCMFIIIYFEMHHERIENISLKTLRKSYERKKYKKGWTEQQFLIWYRKSFMFWYPISIFIIVFYSSVLFIFVYLCVIHQGTIAFFKLTLVLILEILFTSAIISGIFSGKRIVNMLVKGSIPLYNEEQGEIL